MRSLFYLVCSCNIVDVTLRLLRRTCAVSILPYNGMIYEADCAMFLTMLSAWHFR